MNVQQSKLRAMFYREDGQDYVEIKAVGDPNTIIQKVRAEHAERFPAEWEAFNKGAEVIEVGGTPLTEIPGVTEKMAREWRFKGVRNAEEVANLDDAAVKVLGMQGLTFRAAARSVVRDAEPAKRGPGRPPKAAEPAAIA